MKKLLSISVALLSLNLHGADKPIISTTGLEGWGKKDGVNVLPPKLTPDELTFGGITAARIGLLKKQIANQVKLRFILSGIKVTDHSPSKNYLLIHETQRKTVSGRVGLYLLSIEAKRPMTFEANGKTYRKITVVWDRSVIVTYDELTVQRNKLIDEFIIDYLKANPKKEKE